MAEQENSSSITGRLQIILPAVLAIALFVFSAFFLFVPLFKNSLISDKHESCKQLVDSAWSILKNYNDLAESGRINSTDARHKALEKLRAIRYGDEAKDYFWVIDLHPVMIMHPYKPELEGQDLSQFIDARGKKMFVRMAEIGRTQGSGFVEYMWQWKDDPSRIVPKLSYVRLFKPWQWVIGTGIYLDDVDREISILTRKIINISVLIIGFVSVLLFFLIHRSLQIEKRRRQVSDKLAESELRYRTLVEAAGEGIMILEQERIIYCNQAMLELLGYKYNDLLNLGPGQVFEADISGISGETETRIRTSDKTWLRVSCYISEISLGNSKAKVVRISDTRLQRKNLETTNQLVRELQAAQLIFNQPVKNFLARITACLQDISLAEAIRLMISKKSSALLVWTRDKKELVGILSDREIRNWILSGGNVQATSVKDIMDRPVKTVSEDTPVFEAITIMQQEKIRHLPVLNPLGEVTGMVDIGKLLEVISHSSSFIRAEIQQAESVDQILLSHQRVGGLVKALIDSGANSKSVCRIITGISDTVAEKLVEFAQKQLGPAPADFIIIALGSEGREEQTLVADQDNAIIYQDPGDAGTKKTYQDYFLKLGELVTGWLDMCGYSFCPGDIMAKNPKWCQPLSVWKNYFSSWIRNSTPQDLLEINIFFDFRKLYGNEDLTRELRGFINREIQATPPFLLHLARNALLYKPPLSFFGNIQLESSGNHSRTFDIKEAMLPLVNFARIYALKHNVSLTNTQDRLSHLYYTGILSRTGYNEIIHLYDYLMRIRFRHQAEAIAANKVPDNHINPKSLTESEQKLLKDFFNQINVFQKKLSYDFTGSGYIQ